MIRPLTVAIASIGTGMTGKEVLLAGWIAPRGIVCAAIAGVMGPLLMQEGYVDGEKLLPLAFAIVLVTVTLHGLTAKPFARRLGLATDDASGLVIAGTSDWTIQLAGLLKQRGVPVLIADTNWHHLRPARLADIPVYYGEILSDEAEFDVEFAQFGTLLAATDNSAYNAFVCNAFAADFNRERVLQIATREEGKSERKKFATTRQGRSFVSGDIDYYDWWHRYTEGWRFRATRIGPESEDASEEKIVHKDEIKIGVITKGGMLQFRTPDHEPQAKEGDIVLVFAKVEEKEKRVEKTA